MKPSMRATLAIWVLALAAVAAARPLPAGKEKIFEFDKDGPLILLDGARFKPTLQQAVGPNGAGLLVDFYAPWCPHSKKFKPTIEKAAEELKKSGIPVGALNVDEAPDIADEHNVASLPTVMFMVYVEDQKAGGSVFGIPFDGDKTADELVAFAKEQYELAR